MKKHTMWIAAGVIALVASGAVAQEEPTRGKAYFASAGPVSEKQMRSAMTNYQVALQSGNQGLVESALAHIAYLALSTQGQDFGELTECVEQLERSGSSAEIQYKASLTSLALRNPGLFKIEDADTYEYADQLFAALSGRLQHTFLVDAGRH